LVSKEIDSSQNDNRVGDASHSSTPRSEIMGRQPTVKKDDLTKSEDASKKGTARKSTSDNRQRDFRQFTKFKMASGSTYKNRFWNQSNPDSQAKSPTILQEGDLGRALRATSRYFDRIAPQAPTSIAASVHAFLNANGDSRGRKPVMQSCQRELLMEAVPEDHRVDVRKDVPVM
jgi:hypothetical protein